jgi:hypothetical protein
VEAPPPPDEIVGWSELLLVVGDCFTAGADEDPDCATAVEVLLDLEVPEPALKWDKVKSEVSQYLYFLSHFYFFAG